MVGIECSGTYGAALAWFLMDRGEDVREVPAGRTFRERNRRRAAGKSDPVDAAAIARVVARGEHLPVPKRAGLAVDIRLLNGHRDQLIRSRTQLANRSHRDLVILKPGYQKRVRSLRSKKNVREALALLAGDGSVRSELARSRLENILHLDDEIYGLGKRIAAKLEELNTSLTQIVGGGHLRRCDHLGCGRRRHPHPLQSSVRIARRHRATGGVLGDEKTAQDEPRRQPSTQPRAPRRRQDAVTQRSRGASVRRSQDGGRQVLQGSDSLPTASPNQRRVSNAHRGR